MVTYELHGNRAVGIRIPVAESSVRNYSEADVERLVRQVLGVRVKALSIVKFFPLFKKYNFYLHEKLYAKQNKLKGRVFVVFKSEDFLSKILNKLFQSNEALYIAGFYEPTSSIIVISFFLRDPTINENNYAERLTPNGVSYLYKILIHELTHSTFKSSATFRQQCRTYIHGFYSDFFGLMFTNPKIYSDLIRPYYDDSIIGAGGKIDYLGYNDIEKIIAVLKNYKSSSKDKQLLQETIDVYNLILREELIASKFLVKQSFQKNMKMIYEKRGIVEIIGYGRTIHGQELYIPSEIMCVTCDKVLISNTGKKYAEIMVKNL